MQKINSNIQNYFYLRHPVVINIQQNDERTENFKIRYDTLYFDSIGVLYKFSKWPPPLKYFLFGEVIEKMKNNVPKNIKDKIQVVCLPSFLQTTVGIVKHLHLLYLNSTSKL